MTPLKSHTNKQPQGQGIPIVLLPKIQFQDKQITWINRWYPSVCAGSEGLGWSNKSWIPTRICFTVMAGLHPYKWIKVGKNDNLGPGITGYSQAETFIAMTTQKFLHCLHWEWIGKQFQMDRHLGGRKQEEICTLAACLDSHHWSEG